jgi:hypothetical protein
MSSLIERYLAAATRGIPDKQKADIVAELRSSIADEVEDRVAAGEDRTAAERSVLEGLGEPTRLAAGIAGRPMYLIGPDLFLVYRHVLFMLLAIVPAIVGVVAAAVELSDGAANFGGAVVAGLGGAFNVAVHLGFWITLTFAFIERADAARETRDEIKATIGKWTVDMLPSLPSGRISAGETVGEVLGTVLGIGGILWLSTASWFTDSAGAVIPFFNPALPSLWVPALIAVLVIQAVVQVVVFLAGRWTIGLASVFAVVQLAFSVPVIALALTGSLINPAFAAALGWPPLAQGDGPVMPIGALLVALVTGWEIVDAFRRARRASMTAVPA